jgi:hypothetical protein
MNKTNPVIGVAKRDIKAEDDFIQIDLDIDASTEPPTISVSSPDIEFSELGKTLLINALKGVPLRNSDFLLKRIQSERASP